MLTTDAIERIKQQTVEFFKRQNDVPTSTWKPTISKEEKEQRESDIKAGIIPF